MKIALLACVMLAGCAGHASYDVRPFYSAELGRMVCCAATVESSRDIQSVTVDAIKTGDDYTIHFSESGVNASAPISANTAAVSAVAGAVTATANAAAKFSLKP
ncbi:hypothetical protein BLA17378_04477 [Burkholderia aenigmatica]|uniref:Lipoprotein n=1 Tax=Burkholderia aenigmatica TaxID=2015348 RepID=A0ABY6XVH2_9BURK|nr:hypothetical protein [Burkholderia aenigmatica]VWC89633.1 hypothetical protein BLA17378_04477 [Burkholderia aenigmatica]